MASSSVPVASSDIDAEHIKPERKQKPKKTFMLHDPETFANLGKFVSTDFRYAALKAASRGHTKILLRVTDTKLVYEFQGAVIELSSPQVVKRGERTITYSKKPGVKFVKKYVYSGEVVEDDVSENDEKVEKKKKSRSKRAKITEGETPEV